MGYYTKIDNYGSTVGAYNPLNKYKIIQNAYNGIHLANNYNGKYWFQIGNYNAGESYGANGILINNQNSSYDYDLDYIDISRDYMDIFKGYGWNNSSTKSLNSYLGYLNDRLNATTYYPLEDGNSMSPIGIMRSTTYGPGVYFFHGQTVTTTGVTGMDSGFGLVIVIKPNANGDYSLFAKIFPSNIQVSGFLQPNASTLQCYNMR